MKNRNYENVKGKTDVSKKSLCLPFQT